MNNQMRRFKRLRSAASNALIEAEKLYNIRLSDQDIDEMTTSLENANYSKIFNSVCEISNQEHIFRLTIDVFQIIFSSLSNEEVFALRAVSKKMKEVAETILLTRNDLRINSKVTAAQLRTLCDVFANIESLAVGDTSFSLTSMATVCAGKFARLVDIEIEMVANLRSAHVLAECFPKITRIKFVDCGVDVSQVDYNPYELVLNMSSLLMGLKHVEDITFSNMDEKAIWCVQVCRKLKSITWSNGYEFEKPMITQQLNIEKLSYNISNSGEDDLFDIIAVFMKKLKSLSVVAPSFAIHGFGNLHLPDLQSIDLNIEYIPRSVTLSVKHEAVTKIDIQIKKINEQDMCDFLSNFPHVEELSIHIREYTENDGFFMRHKFLQIVSGLHRLKRFKFIDCWCTRQRYVLGNKVGTNFMVSLLNRLLFVNEIDLKLSFKEFLRSEEVTGEMLFTTFESFCKQILDSIQVIATERPSQRFYITVPTDYTTQYLLPENMSLSFIK